MNIQMDAKKIVGLFGGPTVLAARLNATGGKDIKLKTVNMWIHRKSIPSYWLGILSMYAQQDRIRFNLRDYYTVEETEDTPPAEPMETMDFLE